MIVLKKRYIECYNKNHRAKYLHVMKDYLQYYQTFFQMIEFIRNHPSLEYLSVNYMKIFSPETTPFYVSNSVWPLLKLKTLCCSGQFITEGILNATGNRIWSLNNILLNRF